MPYDDRRIAMVAMGPGGDPITFWNARYGEPGFAYGDQPNDFLRERAQRLPPGQALCLAEGEGRNAVHLAELGHTVTAQDISPVGLAKAERLAAARGVSITTLCCDLVDFQPEPRSTDLVVAIWMHLPEVLRSEVHRRAAAAGASAGTGSPASGPGWSGAPGAGGTGALGPRRSLAPGSQRGGARTGPQARLTPPPARKPLADLALCV